MRKRTSVTSGVRVFLWTAGSVALLWARFCRAAGFVSPATAESHDCLAAVGQLWASQLCLSLSPHSCRCISMEHRDAVGGFKLAWSPIEGNRRLIGGCASVVTYSSPFIMDRRHKRLGPRLKGCEVTQVVRNPPNSQMELPCRTQCFVIDFFGLLCSAEEHAAGSQWKVAVSSVCLCEASLCNTEGNVSYMHKHRRAAWREDKELLQW